MNNNQATARGTAGTQTTQAPVAQVKITTGFTPTDIQWCKANARNVALNGLSRALPLVANQLRFTAIDNYIKSQPRVTPPIAQTVVTTTKRKSQVSTRSYGSSPNSDARFRHMAEALIRSWITKGLDYILLQDVYDSTNAVTSAQQNGVRQAIRVLKWDEGKVQAVLAKTDIKGLYKVV